MTTIMLAAERLAICHQTIDGLRAQLKDLHAYLDIQHRFLGLHDHMGANLTCQGCALLAEEVPS